MEPIKSQISTILVLMECDFLFNDQRENAFW